MKIFAFLFFLCALSSLQAEELTLNHQNSSTLNLSLFKCTKRISLIDSRLQKIICVYQGDIPADNPADKYFHALEHRNIICSSAEEMDTTLRFLHQDNLFQSNYKVPFLMANDYGHTLIQCALAVEKQAELRHFYHKTSSEICFDTVIELSVCTEQLDDLLDAIDAAKLDLTEAGKIRKKAQKVLKIKP